MLDPDLDLNLLRALDRLLTSGSVSVAARSLGIGQPAMSKQLERLRQVTQDPLLVRAGRTMVLTERALALKPAVQDALVAVEAALRAPARFDPSSAQGSFALAVGEESLAVLAVPLTRLFRAQVPGIDLRLRQLRRESLTELDAGRLDLVVMPDLRPLPGFSVPDVSRFVARPLFDERFVVISADRRRWTLSRFLQAAHVLPAPLGENDVGTVDTLLARQGLKRRVVLTVPSFEAAVRVVAGSDLIATVPSRLAKALGGTFQAPPPLELPELRINMLWHPRLTTDPRHAFVRTLLPRAVGQEASAKPRAR
jgi:DNA-binding transcriptional LysR family regulator